MRGTGRKLHHQSSYRYQCVPCSPTYIMSRNVVYIKHALIVIRKRRNRTGVRQPLTKYSSIYLNLSPGPVRYCWHIISYPANGVFPIVVLVYEHWKLNNSSTTACYAYHHDDGSPSDTKSAYLAATYPRDPRVFPLSLLKTKGVLSAFSL